MRARHRTQPLLYARTLDVTDLSRPLSLRFVYRPLPEEENDVLTELLHGARFSIDSSDCERPPALLKCGEAGCQLEIC